MTQPTKAELKALTVFFQYAAPKYGFYDFKAKALRAHAPQHGLFQKNLAMLRDITQKKGVDLKTFEDHCKFCRKEKRTVEWASEVLPEVTKEVNSLGQNLVDPNEPGVHRLLFRMDPPVSSLPIGAVSSTPSPDIVVDIRAEFTLEDLVEHFSTSFAVARSKDADKTFTGAFLYLLATYSLDVILFAIDYALFDESYVRTPLALQNVYLPQALEEIRLRKARL